MPNLVSLYRYPKLPDIHAQVSDIGQRFEEGDVMESYRNDEREGFPWQEVLKEFAPIPSLLKQVSSKDRAYASNLMLQNPAYLVMEELLAEATIVYSPPKVGGQTIAATLWAHPSIPQPKHIHFLGPKGLAFMQSLIDQTQNHPNNHMWLTLMAHSRWVRVLLAAKRMLRMSGLGAIAPKPVLIAGVREPMGQYLSMVFQAWWMYADSPAGLTADSIRSRMMDDPWRHQCNHWFEDDLAATVGVDVFAAPFPTHRGWEIYENDFVRVLVIRQENLDALSQALGTLYGIDPGTIRIENRNKADEKEYAKEYDAVKKAWHPSERELDEVYAPQYVRHFYSSREIESFRERWRSGGGKAARKAVHSNEKPATSPAQLTEKASERPAAKGDPSSASSHNAWACRPCPHCQQELDSIPSLHETCRERLQTIERVRSFWPVRVLLKCRRLYRRIFRGAFSIR